MHFEGVAPSLKGGAIILKGRRHLLKTCDTTPSAHWHGNAWGVPDRLAVRLPRGAWASFRAAGSVAPRGVRAAKLLVQGVPKTCGAGAVLRKVVAFVQPN